MPRKAPNEVVEHRITFGEFERRELKETLDTLDKQRKTNTQIKAGTTLAVAGIGAGTVWIGYQVFKQVNGIVDAVVESPAGNTVGGLFDTFLYKSGMMSADKYYKKQAERSEDDFIVKDFLGGLFDGVSEFVDGTIGGLFTGKGIVR